MNNNTYNILFFVFLIVGLILLNNFRGEEFSALGALTQLYAKGPQDLYLTAGSARYVPELWYGYGYGYLDAPFRFIWNQPTRFNNYSYDIRDYL